MKIAKSINELDKLLSDSVRHVALVPTMGSLHEGHLSLFRQARLDNETVVASIFVNPTQFGPKEDFTTYPRDLDNDIALLENVGVNILFAPDPSDIYPSGFNTWVDIGELTQKLEGSTRPSHFKGVCTVVTKLFNIIRPDRAYFGQKDAQQLLVIKKLNLDLDFGIEIIAMPTVREPDGLAMSSRNSYLSQNERTAAAVLHRSLCSATTMYNNGERSPIAIKRNIEEMILYEKLAKIDYISMADIRSLDEVLELKKPCLLSIAVYIGNTRLIDNVILGPKEL